MPRKEQIPKERYRPHDKVRALLLEVKRNSRGPQIIVSRAHKNMLRRLLEYEVPEIYNGQVEIKNIAREAGHRSKVAVAALQEGVDPVGACVGMRGIRIQNIVKELSDEKIDVIEWNADPAIFIAKALSPARVSDMLLEEDFDTGRTATVIVPDDQLSLAIGREGQNARLAAKLTGWRIDIKSVSESVLNAFDKLDEPPLNTLREEEPALIEEVTRIVEKKRANRPIPPEEFKTLTEFAKIAERRLLAVREEARSEKRSAMELVRAVVPEHAFQMELEELELDDDILRALGRIANVGELMMRMLSDEEGLQAMLRQGGAADDAMEAIRYALDDLVILRPPTEEKEADQEAREEVEAVTAEAELAEEVAEVAEVEAGLSQSEPESIFEEDAVLPAFVEPEPEPEPERPAADRDMKVRRKQKPARTPIFDEPEPELDEIERRRQSKKKRRQLVYDEERGEIIAKRRRKGSRQRGAWDDLE